MSEVTATGYQGEAFADRRLRVVTNLRQAHTDLAKVDFDADSGEGQLINAVLEAVTELDESTEAAYNATDPAKAADGSAYAIARLRGTQPREATKGQCVAVDCDLDAGTYAAGSLVAYVDGEPDNRWVNKDEVTSAGGANDVDFEAESAGADYADGKPYTAPAGTLTQMVSVSGWNSVTNPTDATRGRDADTAAQALVRSEKVQYARSSNKILSMQGELMLVEGVIDALVVNGSGSVNPVIWDGTTEDADDVAIADVIWDKLAPGCGTTGAESSLTSDGLFTVNFDRATVTQIYAEATIPAGIDRAAFKAALKAAMPGVLGGDVIWADLFAAGKALLPKGVSMTLFIDTSPSPAATDDIAIGNLSIANLDSANITFA